jgi:hypothetical protein
MINDDYSALVLFLIKKTFSGIANQETFFQDGGQAYKCHENATKPTKAKKVGLQDTITVFSPSVCNANTLFQQLNGGTKPAAHFCRVCQIFLGTTYQNGEKYPK